MKFEYKEYNKKVSDDELILDLKRVMEKNKEGNLSMKEYSDYGNYNVTTITRRFGTWNNALMIAGIEIINKQFTEQELLNNLEKVWIAKGSQPTRRDMDNKNISMISSGAYLRKYQKWSYALKRFIDYINSDTEKGKLYEINNFNKSHKTSRDINLQLRFKVMKRDNFKCRICGASPSKDPSVELHVDHIKPWSKGGETVLENLQTLCSNCNWGKSNLE